MESESLSDKIRKPHVKVGHSSEYLFTLDVEDVREAVKKLKDELSKMCKYEGPDFCHHHVNKEIYKIFGSELC